MLISDNAPSCPSDNLPDRISHMSITEMVAMDRNNLAEF